MPGHSFANFAQANSVTSFSLDVTGLERVEGGYQASLLRAFDRRFLRTSPPQIDREAAPGSHPATSDLNQDLPESRAKNGGLWRLLWSPGRPRRTLRYFYLSRDNFSALPTLALCDMPRRDFLSLLLHCGGAASEERIAIERIVLMVESGARPRLEHLAELVKMLDAHAKQHGYDPVLGLMRVVEAFNAQERDSTGGKRGKLGALGFFPNSGRPLNPDDTGASMCLIEKRPDDIVYVDLGQMVINWFALHPEGARDMGRRLIEAADEPAPPPQRTGHPTLPGLP